MNTRGYPIVALGLTLFLAACSSTSEPDLRPDQPGSLVGVWVLEGETGDGNKVFMRAASLSGNRAGYQFGAHGGLKVRTLGPWEASAAWQNLDGLWSRAGRQLVDIRHPRRGGAAEYRLEIISLSSRRLVCRERTDGGS